MKNLLFFLLTLSVYATAFAVPARRTLITLTQPDGTQFEAMRGGDEYYQFYTDIRTGERLIQDAKTSYWRTMTLEEEVASNAQWEARRQSMTRHMQRRLPKGLAADNTAPSATIGHHRLPCLLVNWSDHEFSEVWKKDTTRYHSINDLYEDMMNGGTEYTFQGALGAVNQYFIDQSYGQYEPEFDIIGPVTISQRHDCDKQHVYSPVTVAWAEALDSAWSQGLMTAEMIDQWDNDGDQYVDLIYIFYAGYSSAEGNDEWVWPHNWVLLDASGNNAAPKTYPGAHSKFYNYSCSSELSGMIGSSNLQIDPIGTAAHEFGHAIGLPDFYDTGYNSAAIYGMCSWSNMDIGCYNGNGQCPPSYTTFERMSLGWVSPMELPDSGTIVLTPFDSDSVCYILRNPKNNKEFLTFDCHQQQGWDAYYGTAYFTKNKYTDAHGMLVTHVDYNESAWYNNTVNNTASHPRCTPLPADGKLLAYSQGMSINTFKTELFGDLFPGKKKISGASGDTNSEMRWWTTHYVQQFNEKDSIYKRVKVRDTIDLVLSNIVELPDGSVQMDVFQPSRYAANAIEPLLNDPLPSSQPRLIHRDGQILIRRGDEWFDLRGVKQ